MVPAGSAALLLALSQPCPQVWGEGGQQQSSQGHAGASGRRRLLGRGSRGGGRLAAVAGTWPSEPEWRTPVAAAGRRGSTAATGSRGPAESAGRRRPTATAGRRMPAAAAGRGRGGSAARAEGGRRRCRRRSGRGAEVRKGV